MAEFKIVEMFTSINGEGFCAGQLAFFIRLYGCNLDCSYCDTAWANQADTDFTVYTEEEITAAVRDAGIRNVTLTGGEPLLHREVSELIAAIAAVEDVHVEIETNGSIPLDPFMECGDQVSFTMDYKLPGSRMENAMSLRNLRLLRREDTIKFVVSGRADMDRAREIIELYGLTGKCHIYFSPVFGRIDPAEIVDYMKEYRMNDVNLQLQMHKIVWDPEARGV